jgi:MraZ protein
MALFLSKFLNKVDRKGRVSVPAPFRAELAAETFAGIIVRPSFVSAALDGCGKQALETLKQGVDRLNPFSDERMSFASAIFARSSSLPWDGEGRIVLPAELLGHAHLAERALFVGLGETFQIWEPGRYAEAEAEAIRRACELRGSLNAPSRQE